MTTKFPLLAKPIQDIHLLLLRSLIQGDLVEVSVVSTTQENLWKSRVFSDTDRVTIEALQFVHVFMLKHELREETATAKSQWPRRDKLLDWLVGCVLEVTHEKSVCCVCVCVLCVARVCLARVCVLRERECVCCVCVCV